MLRILCAEDDPETARIVRFFVQGIPDLQVEICCDGGAALDALAVTVPDLVVLDAKMPCMDGMTVLQTMRADPRYAAIPVIFLTAETSSAFHMDCIERGAQSVLTKPFRPQQLVDEIRRQLALAGSGAQAQVGEKDKKETP